MDKSTASLVDFALAQTYDSIGDKAIHAAIALHLDGVACAAGGFCGKPCIILRSLASEVRFSNGMSAYGVAEKTVPEYGIFANTAATRHQDFNDSLFSGRISGTHPSDMTPAIVAAVEMTGGSGRDIILGMHIGYEVISALGFAYDFRTEGWDQSTQIGCATAIATGRLLGLDAKGLANAIAIALTPGSSLRVTRAGHLSHWKGCSTGQAAMYAFMAARLARAGLTGPSDVFEGVDGFFKQITRRPLNFDHIGNHIDGMSALERTSFKFFMTEYNSQGPVAILTKLRQELTLDEIETIDVTTYWAAWHEIGGGQGDAEEKWDPQTRESADHSLPYLAAVALVDGRISVESFSEVRFKDPTLRPLMRKVRVHWNPEMDKAFARDEYPVEIVITLKNGRVLKDAVRHPRGSWRNRMTKPEINEKYDWMMERVLDSRSAGDLRDMLWNLDNLDNIDGLTSNFRSWQMLAEE